MYYVHAVLVSNFKLSYSLTKISPPPLPFCYLSTVGEGGMILIRLSILDDVYKYQIRCDMCMQVTLSD